MRDVTFGITTFERPGLLQNLIRSIQQRYPLARIVVADNGKEKAILPNTVQRLNLPFDCGLSSARNALIDTLATKYLLILEDDFLFCDETKIEPLVEVLSADEEVGVVGGAIRSHLGRVALYALDIEVFRKTLHVREATSRVRFTPSGLTYRLCDMTWNFALFRNEMLKDHRWNDRLKVGEHCPFYHQVKLGGRWRVAACAATKILHVPQPRSAGYIHYRRRAHDLFHSYLQEQGIERYHRELPYHFEDDEHDKPNVVVLGVGHSGTSVLTRMLHALGWNPADADRKFAESRSVRNLNVFVEKYGRLPRRRALQVLAQLPQPWAIKDPRFVFTLQQWTPLFANFDRKPLLLRVQRDRESMLASYVRRRAKGDVAQRIDHYRAICRAAYESWPWQRMTIDYELLGPAVSLFDRQRYDAGIQRARGILQMPAGGAVGALGGELTTDSSVAATSVLHDSAMAPVTASAWRKFVDGSRHEDSSIDWDRGILPDGSWDGSTHHRSDF